MDIHSLIEGIKILFLNSLAGVKLNKVVSNLSKVGIKKIFEELKAIADENVAYGDEPEVEVFIPKFTTESHFTLSPILKNVRLLIDWQLDNFHFNYLLFSFLFQMGIVDLFDAGAANLAKIAKGNYVSSIFHATRIIVNEEGTEAGAVTTAVLANKITPARFNANRPFVYMIVEKTARVLLFAGEVRSNV